MRALCHEIDDFLRGVGRFAVGAPARRRLGWLLLLVAVCGTAYGVAMGTFSGLGPGRWLQLVYSGVKVPLLMLVTFGLCLPTFFVLNTVSGLRDDFGQAVSAVAATQAGSAVVLAGLSPVTLWFYASCGSYQAVLLFNLGMFAVAWVAAQRIVSRYYAPLVAQRAGHRRLLRVWFVLYGFVGIQMAWLLRPFVGAPNLPVTFFREGAWGNAYVVVASLLASVWRQMQH